MTRNTSSIPIGWIVLHWMQWLLAALSVICVFLPDSRLLQMTDTNGWRLILFIVALYTGWSFLAKRLTTFVLAIRLQRSVLATPWKEAIKSSAMRCLVGNWRYSHVEHAVSAVAEKYLAQKERAEADRQRQEVARRAAEQRAREQFTARCNRVFQHAVKHGFDPEDVSAFVAQLTDNAHDDDRLISRITRAGQILNVARNIDASPARDMLVSQAVTFLTIPDADLEAVATYVKQRIQLSNVRLTTEEMSVFKGLHGGENGIVDLSPIIRTVEQRVSHERERAQRLTQLAALQARYSVLNRSVQISIRPLLDTACAAVNANSRTFRKACHALETALNAADSSHTSYN